MKILYLFKNMSLIIQKGQNFMLGERYELQMSVKKIIQRNI